MASSPLVDINLFVYNGEAGVTLVLESLLAQTWPNFTVTLFDDGSSDATSRILREYATRFRRVRIHRNTCNGGAVAAFQQAFRWGDADFVMPKSGDDPIAPNFIERIMEVLLAHPACAMCHAAGLVFRGEGVTQGVYPESHRLLGIGADPVARAAAVMRTYTSSPSFWGIYRRSAVDLLAPFTYRAGWDHVVLAELALYGEIRHVPEILYWRRGGGRPALDLALRATLAANRGLSLDGPLAESRWRTPLITTAYAHLEMFAVARIDEPSRHALMVLTPAIFRDRWLPALLAEACRFKAALPSLTAAIRTLRPELAVWATTQLMQSLQAVRAILPDQDFGAELCDLATLPACLGAERLAVVG